MDLGSNVKARQRGMALPAVVWFTLILFLIIAAVLNLTLAQKQEAATNLLVVQRTLAAEAAIKKRLWEFLGDNSLAVDVLEQNPVHMVFEGMDIEVYAFNEAGKINLNLADRELLAGFFETAGLDAGRARAIVDDILDKREQTGGFQVPGQVLEVEGFTRSLFQCLKDDLTVYSGNSKVRLEYASERVLAVLKATGDEDAYQAQSSVLKPEHLTHDFIWRLRAVIGISEKSFYTLDQVIGFSGVGAKPYVTYEWEEGFSAVDFC